MKILSLTRERCVGPPSGENRTHSGTLRSLGIPGPAFALDAVSAGNDCVDILAGGNLRIWRSFCHYGEHATHLLLGHHRNHACGARRHADRLPVRGLWVGPPLSSLGHHARSILGCVQTVVCGLSDRAGSDSLVFKAEPKPDSVSATLSDSNGQSPKYLLLDLLLDLLLEGHSSAILIGICAGVFPVHTLQLLSRYGQAALERWIDGIVKGKDGDKDCKSNEDLAQRLRPRHDLTLLDDMDTWDVERIEQEGVIGIQGMATANIADLVTWTPSRPPRSWIGWIRPSCGWRPAPSLVCPTSRSCALMGLRGASDLVDATQDPAGKLRVVLAAQTLRGTIVEDPIPPAQLAGMRAQLQGQGCTTEGESGFRGKTRMKTLPVLQMRSKPCAWLNGW